MISQSFASWRGFHSNSGTSYIDPNPYPDNLHIVTNALVYRILLNKLTAVGVEFSKSDTSFTVLANKEVIISAGKNLSTLYLALYFNTFLIIYVQLIHLNF